MIEPRYDHCHCSCISGNIIQENYKMFGRWESVEGLIRIHLMIWLHQAAKALIYFFATDISTIYSIIFFSVFRWDNATIVMMTIAILILIYHSWSTRVWCALQIRSFEWFQYIPVGEKLSIHLPNNKKLYDFLLEHLKLKTQFLALVR